MARGTEEKTHFNGVGSKKKIAIVGFAPSSRDLAPFADPAWEIWGENELYKIIPRCDVLFEMHNYRLLNTKIRSAQHLDWLRKTKIPVFMLDKFGDIPASISYPLDMIVAKYGRYLTNSISYMLALAIESEPEEIGLWGVDMATDEEYGSQKPSIEYYLGIAVGKGIKLTVPPQCDLLKTFFLYGYDNEQESLMIDKIKARKKELTARGQQYQKQMEEATGALNQMQGALDDLAYIQRTYTNLMDWAGAKQEKK